MRFLFLVQGEGRGHMTQAITLSNMLQENGHQVVGVIIGKSKRREIPGFFFQKINAEVKSVESPNFIIGKKNKKVKVLRTIIYNAFRVANFIRSLKDIDQEIKTKKPDVIINFYELLCGLYYLQYKPAIRQVCIGHQYLLKHHNFVFPKGHYLDKFFLSLNTRVTSARAHSYLALSFTEMDSIPEKKLFVVPPLIRQEVLDLSPQKKDYILGYILNSGYSDEIIRWHKSNNNTELHFFWDLKDAVEETKISNTLSFHKISDVKFLQYLKDCKGYASTAGFESICEAMYLGKPILMIPTAGHFEQKCNALDASRADAGIVRNQFDLSALVEYSNSFKENTKFKAWVKKSRKLFLNHLTSEVH